MRRMRARTPHLFECDIPSSRARILPPCACSTPSILNPTFYQTPGCASGELHVLHGVATSDECETAVDDHASLLALLDAVLRNARINAEEWVETFDTILTYMQLPGTIASNYDLNITYLSSSATQQVWGKTPFDIREYIAHEVANILDPSNQQQDCGERHYADLSLVCHRWAKKIRPRFFRRIKLPSKEDISFLVEILRSPLSGWLSPFIEILVLGSGDKKELTYMWRCLRGPLSGLLLNIAGLECRGLQAYFQASNCRSAMWPASLRTYPDALHRLSTVSLSGYRFHSFSVLLRQLAALPLLESLEIDNVSWTEPCDPRYLPRCKWAFPEMRSVYAHNCTDYWPFAWIMIVSSLSDDLHRCVLEGVAENVMLCVAQLVSSLWQTHRSDEMNIHRVNDSDNGNIRILSKHQGLEVDLVTRLLSPHASTRSLSQVIVADYDALLGRPQPAWGEMDSMLRALCPEASVDVLYSKELTPTEFSEVSNQIRYEMPNTRVALHHRTEGKGPTIDYIERLKE